MNKSFLLIIVIFTLSFVMLITGVFLTIQRSSTTLCRVGDYNLTCYINDTYENLVNLFRNPRDQKLVKKVEISYSGLNYPSKVMEPLISEYKAANPLVTIKYEERNYDDKDIKLYKDFIKSKLKEGSGSTIFTIHSTWINEFISEISNQNVSINDKEFKERFYPVMARYSINKENKVLAIPLYYDGLGLFYNKDILSSENLIPPTTWDELKVTSAKTIIKSGPRNQIVMTRAGVAMGSVNNITYFPDILSLLITQSNLKFPEDINKEETGLIAYKYLDFLRKDALWSENFPNSINSFAAGQVAFIFAKNSDIEKLYKINPTLNFGIASVPQFPTLDGSRTNGHFASFYSETVSNDASEDEQKAAWDFLVWLSKDEQQKKLRTEYLKYTKYPPIYSSMNLNLTEKSELNRAIRENAMYANTNLLTDLSGNDNYVKFIKEGFDKLSRNRSNDPKNAVKVLTEIKTNIQKEINKK